MALLRLLRTCLVLLLVSSCAKFSYLTEQGWGQIKLMSSSTDNEEVLKDENVSKENKDKIRKIIAYKKFFFDFWGLESSEIYSSTQILDRDAVSYLVIASKPNEIVAKKECFPFVGCFPYLGFFKKSSAIDYGKKLEDEGNEIYMRKVLAYSTLGKLNDPILSTFFYYNEFELAETIFHELFHTIFFAKDEVDLNENLANFFGKAMVNEYFGSENKKATKHYKSVKKNRELFNKISFHTKVLIKLLKEKNWKERKQIFIETIFKPSIKKECLRLKLKNCWPLKLKWNSATFAAFRTYEKGQNKIALMMSKFDGNIKTLFKFIQKSYEEYEKQSNIKSFEKFLLK